MLQFKIFLSVPLPVFECKQIRQHLNVAVVFLLASACCDAAPPRVSVAVDLDTVVWRAGEKLTDDEVDQLIQGVEDSQGNINYEGQLICPYTLCFFLSFLLLDIHRSHKGLLGTGGGDVRSVWIACPCALTCSVKTKETICHHQNDYMLRMWRPHQCETTCVLWSLFGRNKVRQIIC